MYKRIIFFKFLNQGIQRGYNFILGEKCTGTPLQSRTLEIIIRVKRHRDDTNFRHLRAEPRNQLQTVHGGHQEVYQRNLWLQLLCQTQTLLRVCRRPDHLQVLVTADITQQRVEKKFIIINDEYSDPTRWLARRIPDLRHLSPRNNPVCLVRSL